MNIPIYEKCDIIKRLFGEGSGGGDAHHKGWFANPDALRTAYPTSENGDYAIVGSTNSVWVWDSASTSWKDTQVVPTEGANKDLGNLTSTGESHFLKSTNLKTVNNISLIKTSGSDNDIPIKTYQPFPADFITEGTLKEVSDSIRESSGRGQGKAYLGQIRGACMPKGEGNGECKVEYMSDTIAVMYLNSSNNPPYQWVYNIDARDYIWRQHIAQYPSTLPSKDAPAGTIVQYAGTTSKDYTNGYFYKASIKPGTVADNTWTQVNVQPAAAFAAFPRDVLEQSFSTTVELCKYFRDNHPDKLAVGNCFLSTVNIPDLPSLDHGGEMILKVFGTSLFQLDFFSTNTEPHYWFAMYFGGEELEFGWKPVGG